MFDFSKEDPMKDKPRPVKLSLEGLSKEYHKMGDSLPVKLNSLDYNFFNEHFVKMDQILYANYGMLPAISQQLRLFQWLTKFL